MAESFGEGKNVSVFYLIPLSERWRCAITRSDGRPTDRRIRRKWRLWTGMKKTPISHQRRLYFALFLVKEGEEKSVHLIRHTWVVWAASSPRFIVSVLSMPISVRLESRLASPIFREFVYVWPKGASFSCVCVYPPSLTSHHYRTYR